jgi:hypothetical protein
MRRLLRTSWRQEYLQRSQIYRDWGRGWKAFQFDARVGTIDQFFVDFESSILYAASKSKGII